MLPAVLDETRYVTDSSPNTLRKMVRAWPLAEQRAFFEREVGVPLVEEPESAKLFPASQRARDVRDGLLALAARRGVRLVPDTRVTDLVPTAAGSAATGWDVAVADAPPIVADAVVVATGGLSVPNTGSDGAGLRMLERLGHTLHPTYAALTPVTADASSLTELAGISLRVALTAHADGRSATASGGFLFTHRGYSGPSVLDVSHVMVRARTAAAPASALPPARLTVRWTAHAEAAWDALLRPASGPLGARAVAAVVRAELPDRLAAVLLAAADVDPTRRLAELTRDERRRLVETLVRAELPWSGDEGYKKAEVTGGGVRLSDVDPRTLESRVHPGLYLCGEVLDAFGPIGGYNFLWAWATGRSAGRASAATP